MRLQDILNHLLNFCAPAFALAVMMPVFVRLTATGKQTGPGYLAQSSVNFVVCLTALLVGLWIGGQDGKMATYAAMVLACATTQWLMQGAWRV